MTKIKNLIGSPLDIETTTGPRVLPAYGEIEAELAPGYLEAIGAAPYIEVITVTDVDPLDQWRALYKDATGKEADKRWSEKRLIEEIEKAGD